MKTFILSVLMLVISALTFAQSSVRTEQASNIYSYHSALTTGDTIVTVNSTTYKSHTISGLYLVRLNFDTPVASDTVIIKNGLGVVGTWINTSDVKPYGIELGFRVDTSLVYIQKKGSLTTLVYRVETR